MDKGDYEFDSERDRALCERAQEQQDQIKGYVPLLAEEWHEPIKLAEFAPHCPACLSANLVIANIPGLSRTICQHCGENFPNYKVEILRLLPSQPAPPYTGAEIMRMAYEYGHDIWGNGEMV